MDRIEYILSKATVEEKVRLLTGHHNWYTYDIKRLRCPSITMSDGPHGLRKVKSSAGLGLEESYPATCFPPAATLAASFDVDLVNSIGTAIGKEARAHGVHLVLGPGVNIKRNPLCGRNFEYFSEDPLLAGKLGAAMIQGIQSQGVGATLKHYLANNQETDRFISNSVIDERALNEIYLKPFEIAIKEGQPWAVMTSYNRVNGRHVNTSYDLINGILRERFQYQGLVMSDWGAYLDPVNSLKAGLDLQMPGGLAPLYEVEEAIRNDELSLKVLDTAVARVARLALKVHEVDPLPVPKVSYQEHFELARKAAREAIVLLKNDGNLLPLKKKDEVLIVGPFAKKPHYQGGGSSQVNPVILDNAIAAFQDAGVPFQYIEGFSASDNQVDPVRIAQAREIAAKVKKVILFLGLNDQAEIEGFDRTSLALPKIQTDLIKEFSEVNPQIIVVISAGAPVIMPWIEQAQGVVFTYLGGAASGHAVVDVLTGAVNPSGRLPESFPLSYEDVPSARRFARSSINVEYRESIFVGYRYYERAKRPVLFPFGFGLSYTNFKLDNLVIDRETIKENDAIKVSLTVTNTGKVDGAEVVQLYVSQDHPSIFRPQKTLKAFKKIFLKAKEQQLIEFTITSDDFTYYNIVTHSFALESGIHRIQIGHSSAEIKLSARVDVVPEHPIEHLSFRRSAAVYYNLPESGMLQVRYREFEAIFQNDNVALAHYLPKADRPFTLLNTIEDAGRYWQGRLLVRMMQQYARKLAKGDQIMLKQYEATALKIPLGSIAAVGSLTYRQVLGLLAVMNGHLLSGFSGYLFGARRGKKRPSSLSRRRK